MPEIASPLLQILVNLLQVYLYLPFYFSLLDSGRVRSIEYLATTAALMLNAVAILKKLVIIAAHLPFLWGTRADALFHVADGFLVVYFGAVYLPSWISRKVHATKKE